MKAALCIVVASAALLLPSGVLAAEPIPGTYAGAAKGVRATVAISNDHEATISYALKTACGRTKGRIALGQAKSGAFKGKRISRGPQSSIRQTIVKLKVAADGEVLGGKLVDSLKGGDSKLSGCHGKRPFVARLGETDAFVPSRAAGHYEGTNADGRPVGFDVVDRSGSGLRVENLLIDVDGLCTTLEDDELEVARTAHLSFATAEIAPDGRFDIVQAPDDYNEFTVSGKIADGRAELRGSISGDFTDAGIPDLLGDWNCDGADDSYAAIQQRGA